MNDNLKLASYLEDLLTNSILNVEIDEELEYLILEANTMINKIKNSNTSMNAEAEEAMMLIEAIQEIVEGDLYE